MFDKEIEHIKKNTTRREYKALSKEPRRWRKEYDKSVDEWSDRQRKHREKMFKGIMGDVKTIRKALGYDQK